MTDEINQSWNNGLVNNNFPFSNEEMAAALNETVASHCGSGSCQSLNDQLVNRLEDVLIGILGEPNSQNDSEWRWGSNGSLAVNIDDKRGQWYSHEENSGGAIIKLLARTWKLNPSTDKEEVEQRAKALLEGLPDRKDRPRQNAEAANHDNKWTGEEAVELFWYQGDDLSEKHGRAYLLNRGIDPEIETSIVREVQHKSNKTTREFPAISFPMRNAVEEIVAIQAIRCPAGTKLANVPKITNGSAKGAAIKLPGNKTANGELVIVEGPEDALSVWQQTGIETWATCSVGNLGSAPVLQQMSLLKNGTSAKSPGLKPS